MMRRLSYGLLAVLLLVACAKENQEPEWEGPVIELSVSCLDPTDPTKAGSDGTEAGENPYHENLISWVDFYFYPGGATSDQATYHIRRVSGRRDKDVFRLELTTNQVNYRIFPVLSDITEATVFAIANAPEDLLDELDDTSLDNIKRQVVSTNFEAKAGEGGYTNHRQDRLMMSGETTLTLAGRSQKVVSQGVVNLSRYACKITVGIKMDDVVKIDTGKKDDDEHEIFEVWRPSPQQMKIYLEYGVKKVNLSGEPAGTTDGITPTDGDYLSYSGNPMCFYDDSGELYFDKSGDYYNTFPMYTYPYHWVSGGEREPYLKLVLTWNREADLANHISSSQKEFYYKILIPRDRRGGDFVNSFVRNNWYHYDINVGVLGADTDEAAVELPATLFVVYWQDKDVVVKNANIGNARYLSVEGSEFELYNQASLTINYTTSNPIKFKSIRVTRPYYGINPTVEYNSRYGADVKRVSYNDVDTYDDDLYPEGSYYLDYSETQRKALAPDGKDWLQDNGEGSIIFTHALVNVIKNQKFDYSPYTITFEVAHADNTQAWMDEYNKKVKIIQKPAIYIEATPNPDSTIVDNGNYNSSAEYHGYVYINNELDWYTQEKYFDTKPNPTSELWRVIAYNGGGTDMYKINATVLETNSEFVIGDPRVTTVNNIREYAEGPAIEGGTRTLKWYYPTEETDRTENMIAPAYRISTKLSGTARDTKINHTQAIYRCAALQENGFPAGRWRLPTMAEIRFAAQLSANNVFTPQFSDYYWSANGVVSVHQGSGTVTPATTQQTAYIRCVYDSWYWGDDRVVADTEKAFRIVNDNNGTPSVFVWGDAER